MIGRNEAHVILLIPPVNNNGTGRINTEIEDNFDLCVKHGRADMQEKEVLV